MIYILDADYELKGNVYFNISAGKPGQNLKALKVVFKYFVLVVVKFEMLSGG